MGTRVPTPLPSRRARALFGILRRWFSAACRGRSASCVKGTVSCVVEGAGASTAAKKERPRVDSRREGTTRARSRRLKSARAALGQGGAGRGGGACQARDAWTTAK